MWENNESKKDLNLLLWTLTNFGFFVFMCVWFFLGNITVLVFLYYRLFKNEKYTDFINNIQTTETFSFKKKIDVEPLYDEDDDWKEYQLNEDFKQESIEVEDILKWLQKKQLWGTNPKSNIHRYIYGGMESSLLGYILWTFATINWILNANFSWNSDYALFTTFLMIWLFFFYNMIFEKIYWTKSQFELIDRKVWETFKRAKQKALETNEEMIDEDSLED